MAGDLTKEKTVELLLEEWKLAAEMADRVSARRLESSKLYTSLLTGLLAAMPLIVGNNNLPYIIQKMSFIGISTLGICLCLVWVLNLRSYRQINSIKFETIHEMEQKLPFPYFTREWQIIREQPKQTYTRLSKIEQAIPFLIIIPYVAMLVYTLFFF